MCSSLESTLRLQSLAGNAKAKANQASDGGLRQYLTLIGGVVQALIHAETPRSAGGDVLTCNLRLRMIPESSMVPVLDRTCGRVSW